MPLANVLSKLILVAVLLACSSVFAQPANDDCANAIDLNCGDFVLADTTNANDESLGTCGTNDGNGGLVWYRFVGTGDEVIISTCNPATNYDSKLRVYTGSCGNFSCVVGNDDTCGLQAQVTFVSVDTTVYYIAVHGFSGANGTAEVSLACFPPPQPAVNDNCVDAIDVVDGNYLGDTRSNNTDGDSTCANASNAPSVWYRYTATNDWQLRVSLCNPGYDSAVSVWSDCPNNSPVELGCDDDSCGSQGSYLIVPLTNGEDYYIRVAGNGAASGTFTMNIETVDPTSVIGPDVTYSDCTSIAKWGPVGGIHAYALGSHTCNIGDEDLAWGGTNPLLAMNAYRIIDGRIEQIGLSFVKNGTGAAAGNGCGVACNGNGGSVLGAGCLDVYGSGFNGIQSILGPRSQVNGYTGSYPGASGPTGEIEKRLQVKQSDMDDPGAIYFIEGVYVAFDDAAAGNAYNNASYKPVTIDGSYNMSPTGSMLMGVPAIQAWADHGNGLNSPDTSVDVQAVDIPNEGRFHVASKVEDLGGGSWRYTYAVFNLNSHQSADGFSIPTQANISNVGFNDVDYHSGEAYDNTDWVQSNSGSAISWDSPETFAQNANTNALRWGTMYTFWFDADQGPEAGTASLSLFRPGTTSALSVNVQVPGTVSSDPQFDRGDCNNDGSFDLSDAVTILGFLFPSGAAPMLDCQDACDANDDAALNVADAIAMLSALFGGGGPLPAPHGSCGTDSGASLGCDNFTSC